MSLFLYGRLYTGLDYSPTFSEVKDFKFKGAKKSNKKHEDTDSVFLLGKELAHDAARGQVDRLANALGRMTKADAKKWGTNIENAAGSGGTNTSSSVSGKVCGKGTNGSGTNQCGKNGTGTNNTIISTAFTAGDAALLSSDATNVDTRGMAT